MTLKNHDDVLEAIAASIDIPDSMYESTQKSYKAIGSWLERDDSSIKDFKPKIYAQGSFALGTVVRPLGDKDEYDIDLVCTLSAASKQSFSMAQLKRMVGEELYAYTKAHNMQNPPTDNRRCWTLEYADSAKFHVDILPSVRNTNSSEGSRNIFGSYDQHIIAITDKKHSDYDKENCSDWPTSNPKGYALWFNSRQLQIQKQLKEAKFRKNKGFYARVDDIPDFKVKSPLQRAIQLLKRHRDSTRMSTENKPISIIISTLAAMAYNGEENIVEALRTILKDMPLHIKDYGSGETRIENPTNPDENFADKWIMYPKRKDVFYKWLDKAQADFGKYINSPFNEIPSDLRESFSHTTINTIKPLLTTAVVGVTSSEVAAQEVQQIKASGLSTKPWCK